MLKLIKINNLNTVEDLLGKKLHLEVIHFERLCPKQFLFLALLH
jgi:hypothetical protein